MRNLPSALVNAPYLSNPPLLYRRSETCALSIGIPLIEFRTSPCTLAGFSSVFGGWVCARPRAAAPSHSQAIALLLRLRIRVLQRNYLEVLHDPVAFLELDFLPALEQLLEHVQSRLGTAGAGHLEWIHRKQPVLAGSHALEDVLAVRAGMFRGSTGPQNVFRIAGQKNHQHAVFHGLAIGIQHPARNLCPVAAQRHLGARSPSRLGEVGYALGG